MSPGRIQKRIEHLGIANVANEIQTVRFEPGAEEIDHLRIDIKRRQGNDVVISFCHNKQELSSTKGFPPRSLKMPSKKYGVGDALLQQGLPFFSAESGIFKSIDDPSTDGRFGASY